MDLPGVMTLCGEEATLHCIVEEQPGGNNTSKTDVAPWRYKWAGLGMGWDGCLGGGKYGSTFNGANNDRLEE